MASNSETATMVPDRKGFPGLGTQGVRRTQPITKPSQFENIKIDIETPVGMTAAQLKMGWDCAPDRVPEKRAEEDTTARAPRHCHHPLLGPE